MRRNSGFLLGAAAGACLTLLAVQPRGVLIGAAANAAGSTDIYSQLNLFGDVFERIKADYVEKFMGHIDWEAAGARFAQA